MFDPGGVRWGGSGGEGNVAGPGLPATMGLASLLQRPPRKAACPVAVPGLGQRSRPVGAAGWEGQEVSAFHRLLQVQGDWVWGLLEGPPPRLLLMDPVCPALPTSAPLPERGQRSRWLSSPECALPSVCVWGGPSILGQGLQVGGHPAGCSPRSQVTPTCPIAPTCGPVAPWPV